jgi:short-subunit dehydrogenase/acyl dehydratase/acyl carrier protein
MSKKPASIPASKVSASRTRDRTYDDFAVGDYVHFQRRFSAADHGKFAALSGDLNPLHHDKAYAANTPFGSPVVPLFLAAAPLSAIAGCMLPGHRSLILSSTLRALAPVPYDTDISYSATVVTMHEANETLALRVIAFREHQVLLDADLLVRVRNDVSADQTPSHDSQVEIHRGGQSRVLITGAGGAIGAAAARSLAKSGRSLLLHHNKSEIGAIADACRKLGGDVETIAADLNSAKGLDRIAARVEKGDVRAIIHTASPPIRAPLDSLVNVNHTSLRRLADAALPAMLAAQDGHVVFVGSSAVQHNVAGWEDYIAAKVAASNWTIGLNSRYGAWGIAGTVVAPGYVRTKYSADIVPPGAETMLPEEVGACIASCIGGGKGTGSYVWLEPGSARIGGYGFRSRAAVTPAAAVSRDAAALSASDLLAPALASTQGEVERLVRRFFRASRDTDMSEAGVDRFPGWDSLRHVELMLFLERELSITFAAADIERTTDMQSLTKLLDGKHHQSRMRHPSSDAERQSHDGGRN